MAVKETVEQLGLKLKMYTQESIIANGHVGTGRLLNSVQQIVTNANGEYQISLAMEDYGWQLNERSGFYNQAQERLAEELQPALETAAKQEIEAFLKQSLSKIK